jgi:aldehyde:ferredoxin oxidoreductase
LPTLIFPAGPSAFFNCRKKPTAAISAAAPGRQTLLGPADFSADPLSPEAILILMNGPLTGVKLSGVSRMNATARSPLTGGIAESSCGGHFPPALRLAGFDGLILSGRAKSRPCS